MQWWAFGAVCCVGFLSAALILWAGRTKEPKSARAARLFKKAVDDAVREREVGVSGTAVVQKRPPLVQESTASNQGVLQPKEK